MFSFSSGAAFLLLPTLPGGIYGVLFDDGRKDMPMDVYVNVIFVFLDAPILKIPRWRGIVDTFELAFCWLDAHNLFFVWWNK